MPTLLEAPPEANPFADLIGGDNGGPAYQTVAGRFSEVPKAAVVTPTELGAFQDMVPGPGRDVQMPAVEQDLGIFQALVPQSPTAESEKALAEVPKPPDPGWTKVEKEIENKSGLKIHEFNNAVRVFGQSAGHYIFDGMMAFERNRAALEHPKPGTGDTGEFGTHPAHAADAEAGHIVLPDGSFMSDQEQQAFEQQYQANLEQKAHEAMSGVDELKKRRDTAEANTPIDPALARTVPARLAAAAGPVAVMTGESMIPGIGLPLMVMHGALATEQEALDAGATPEQAQRASVRSAIGLAIFGGFSKFAAAAVAKALPVLVKDPSQLTRFIAQFTGQEAANETSSRVISAWNAAADAPEGQKVQAATAAATETTLENTVMNSMYALAHAAKASRPKLTPEAPASPASEPEPAPVTTPGGTAETARYVEPAREDGVAEKLTGSAVQTSDGQVFVAPIHSLALQKAEAAGAPVGSGSYENGFVTDKGRFVDRYEALDIAHANAMPITSDAYRGGGLHATHFAEGSFPDGQRQEALPADLQAGSIPRSDSETTAYPLDLKPPKVEYSQPDPTTSAPNAASRISPEPEGNDWTGATAEPEPAAETTKPAEPAEPIETHAEKLKLKAEKEGGFVNADMLQEAADFGKRVYQKGMDFAKWSAEMVRHLGEKVKAHLKTVWETLQRVTGDERGSIGGNIGLKISGKRNDLNAATTNRSTKLQVSEADATRAQKEINKAVPNARRQAAIAVHIEAGGDPVLLARWEGAAKGKAFRQAAADAQTLTPAEMAIRDKAAQTWEVLGKRGQRFGAIGDKLRDNYVTHVWDVGKKYTGFGSSKLKDKFKFSKARTFTTLFDGDQAGFVPKTMEIGKLLPAYMHELNSVIADRQFVPQAAAGYASDGRPLLVPRGDAKTVDATDYVIRNADGSPLPKFAKAVYDTKADAQAALQPGQKIETREKSSTFVSPRGFREAKDAAGNPIDQSDYVQTNQPALSNWTWVATDPKGNQTFLKGDLLAHPEMAKRLNAMMGQSEIKRWYNEPASGLSVIPKAIAKGLDTAQSVMKREMFGLLAPFHQVQEGTHAVGHTVNPFGGMEDMSKPTPKHVDAMQHGLMLHPEKEHSSTFMEGVGGKNSFLSQIGRKWGGKAGKMVADTIDGYQNYLFKQYIPALKYKTYEHILARNMERYAGHLKSGEVTAGDVKMLSAEQANAAYGHLNYALLDRNPLMQHFMQLGLLAPDFLEARARFVGQAVKGLGSRAGHEQFRAIATLALVQAGAAYTISQLLGDEWDPKHPFEVTHGGRTYTLRSVPEDLFRLFFSGSNASREFQRARWSPGLSSAIQLGTGKNYRGEKSTALQTIGELLANYIPITARSIPGIRQLTETGRNQNITPLEQLAGSLGIKVSRYSPISKTYALASDWKKANGLEDTGVFPVSKYQQLRYSLEDGDFDRAKAEYKKLVDSGMKPEKITSGFHESVTHAFTGSQASDTKFKKSLSAEDRLMFEAAVKKRHEILKRYNALRGR